MKFKSRLRWLVFCCFIFCLVMTFVGVGFDTIYRKGYKPKMKNWRLNKEAHLADYLKEKSFFAAHSFFGQKTKRTKNLANLIIAHIQAGPLISHEERLDLLRLKHKWLERRFQIQSHINLPSLLSALENFDYFEPSAFTDVPNAPEAFDFVILSQMALAEIADSHQEAQQQRLSQLQKLASMLVLSQSFNHKLAALSILAKQQEFLTFIQERHPTNSNSWVTVSNDEILRFRSFLFHTYDYLDFLVGDEILKKVFPKDSFPTGFCSVFALKHHHLEKARVFFGQRLPFEPNFKKEASELRRIATTATTACQWQQKPLTAK